MGTLLFVLAIPAYLYIGYFIGHKSIKVWRSRDNQSLAAKLFFPLSAHNEKVGTNDGFVDVELLRGGAGIDLDVYSFVVTALWPVKMLWNTPGILLFSVPGWIRQVIPKISLGWIRGSRLFPIANDDLLALYQKVRVIDQKIQSLLEIRASVMQEIEDQKIQFSATCEAEEDGLNPPEIPPQLTNGRD
ncbi:hypothetical protein KKF05_00880 [Patescibacteria group bacterium]|nr:hypothetical protein [Patescibacteria group bacterium]MBU1029013.1 hypothetical protein [Patescibacteria group bacterium]MBU1915795.1 hypothetical protein [Patescibacteria group bacterium]